ncbi:CbiQ family ECF transporter T component [Kineococcus vitellinus]|uniref:CbiQ family ECF transporter T component n=1 Tax=Kineococcus vitellinus TaxID=2696565 RepID=UPI0014129E99
MHTPVDEAVEKPVDGAGEAGAAVDGPVDAGVPPTPAQLRSAAPGPPVRSCGPLSLLAVSLLCALGALAVDDWQQAAVALLVQLLCLPLVVGRGASPGRRLVPLAVAALSVGWSTVLAGDSDEPLRTAATAALRLVVLVLPGVLLLGWLDPGEAGDHLAQRLRLPGRVVVAAVAALGQLATLAQVWDQVAAARRVRGLGAGRSPLSRARWAASTAFGLLVDAVRRAGRTAVAMDARGFAAAGVDAPRSWALPAPWRRADSVLLAAGALVAAVPLLVRLLG